MENKVALITGGSTGIGFATAELFSSRGMNVLIVGRNLKTGRDAVDKLSGKSGKVIFFQGDVTNPYDAQKMIEVAISEFGDLHVAVNNAGATGNKGTTAELTVDDFEHYINSNLKSTWLSMKYELSYMVTRQKGSIVNVSSVKGFTGAESYSIYSAAKHGVNGLTKSAAVEYAQLGIRINAVCPIAIQTTLMETVLHKLFKGTSPEEDMLRYGSLLPIRRPGQAIEVAEAIYWLCSDQSSFVTGHLMAVDGGSLARGIP